MCRNNNPAGGSGGAGQSAPGTGASDALILHQPAPPGRRTKPGEKEYLRQLARSEGETMSVVVRRVIREAIRKLEEEGKENANVQKQ
jgi:hypothetical protein